MTIHQPIVAAIDLGSNTFRMLVVECSGDRFMVLAKRTASVRFSRGLAANGCLGEDAMERGLVVLRTFRKILARYQPQHLRICGTEALRRATNSGVFLRRAEEILQQPVDIINGEEEARLCLTGALAGWHKPLSGPLLLVDVGGGSTELILAEYPAGEVRMTSVGLGVVGLTEKYLGTGPPDVDRLDIHLTVTLSAALENLTPRQKKGVGLITGCGGTATSMAALDLKLHSYDASLVHGHVLQDTSIHRLWEKLAVLSAGQRNRLPGLGAGRGEILPAGIRIYQVLLQLLQQDRLRVSDTGLLEGILLSSAAPAVS